MRWRRCRVQDKICMINFNLMKILFKNLKCPHPVSECSWNHVQKHKATQNSKNVCFFTWKFSSWVDARLVVHYLATRRDKQKRTNFFPRLDGFFLYVQKFLKIRTDEKIFLFFFPTTTETRQHKMEFQSFEICSDFSPTRSLIIDKLSV